MITLAILLFIGFIVAISNILYAIVAYSQLRYYQNLQRYFSDYVIEMDKIFEGAKQGRQ